jgi:hypothetical protein
MAVILVHPVQIVSIVAGLLANDWKLCLIDSESGMKLTRPTSANTTNVFVKGLRGRPERKRRPIFLRREGNSCRIRVYALPAKLAEILDEEKSSL